MLVETGDPERMKDLKGREIGLVPLHRGSVSSKRVRPRGQGVNQTEEKSLCERRIMKKNMS